MTRSRTLLSAVALALALGLALALALGVGTAALRHRGDLAPVALMTFAVAAFSRPVP